MLIPQNKNDLIFLLIFSFISVLAIINFGYLDLKTSIEHHQLKDHDAAIYLNIVENGLAGITNDFRSSRIIIPLMAHYLGKFFVFLGIELFSKLYLLIVNSLFIGLSIYIFGLFTIKLRYRHLFETSVLLMLINFATVNYIAQSLLESADIFFYITLLYLMNYRSKILIIIIFIFGILNKIMFLIGGGIILFFYQLKNYFFKPSLRFFLKTLIFNFILIFLCISIYLYLKFEILNGLNSTNDAFLRHISNRPEFFTLTNLKGFAYPFLFLLPFGLVGLFLLDKILFYLTLLVSISLLIFGIFIGADGVSWGRYIFSASCFLYSLGCSNLIHKFKKIFLYDSK